MKNNRRPPSQPIADQPLFRPEAKNHHRASWVGTVSIENSHTPMLVIFFVWVALLGLLALVTFGTYSRQAVMTGLVVPDVGLIKLSSPIVGNAGDVFVKQGQKVQKGTQLFTVTADTISQTGVALGQSTIDSLIAQDQSLRAQLELEDENGQKELELLSRRVEALRQQRGTVARRLVASRRLLKNDAENLAKQEDLLVRQLVTRDSVAALQNAQMERTLSHEQINQELQEQDIAISDAEAAVARRKTELAVSIAQIERSISDVAQQLIAADARRSLAFLAPNSGQITSVQVTPGAAVATGVPLVTIMPEASKLQVHLYGPSRSVGLIRRGQTVALRFEAYPFQRYGLINGRVAAISGSAVNPLELPPELVGLVSSDPADPLFKVVVEIDRLNGQYVNQSLELVPGMKAQANIVLETRPLFKWILSPLDSILASGLQ